MYLITIKGLVQGVGFRPYLYKKAVSLREKGAVRNTGSAVELLVHDRNFGDKLDDLPSLAHITSLNVRELSEKELATLVKEYSLDLTTFTILPSSTQKGAIFIPPDISVCDDCLCELQDPADRRAGYYFITCTNCGPRFSMIRDFTRAYDRPTTAMNKFPMCEACRKEYENQLDRRHHAQTIACPGCGPRLGYHVEGRECSSGAQAIMDAVEEIRKGEVVAVKGNGGYHLCCLVSEEAVEKLRVMTGRPKKPYAVLVGDLEMARRLVEFDATEEKLLLSLRRPIVVLEKRAEVQDGSQRALDLGAICELSSLGVMLPYTALHFLLCGSLGQPLVLTSANLPGNPMTTTLKEIRKLSSRVLEHERDILNRVDDSVLRVVGHPAITQNRQPVFLRRARGWTPSRLFPGHPKFRRYLEKDGRAALALGAMKNNAIAYLTREGIYPSHYLGNSENLRVFEYLKGQINTFKDIANANPEVVVCDLHPDFNTTKLAQELAEEEGMELKQVQHHLAHACGAALEHGLDDWTAIVCDGVGYGTDGKPWGGELFRGCQRVGSLEEQPMIGGDSAAHDNQKMLYGILSKFLDLEGLARMGLFSKEAGIWHQQLKSGFNLHHTTSTGRVLDAAAALLGLSDINHYEGRAPMLLESMALAHLHKVKGRAPGFAQKEGHGAMPVLEEQDRLILKTTPLFEYLHSSILKTSSSSSQTSWSVRLSQAEKQSPGIRNKLAFETHCYLASGLLQMADQVKGDSAVTFSGGVAANTILSSLFSEQGVLLPDKLPPGDGGIAFGQLAWLLLARD